MPTNPELSHPARPLALLLSAVALATLSACANYAGITPSAQPLDASRLGLQNPATKIGRAHV